MFNRFTSRALQVLFYARSQVSQLGSNAVEPEHVLLGVLDEGKGLASRILARTGATLDDFRSDIVRRLTRREQSLSPTISRSAPPASACCSARAKKPIGCCTMP